MFQVAPVERFEFTWFDIMPPTGPPGAPAALIHKEMTPARAI
jgi:hypothetical protein